MSHVSDAESERLLAIGEGVVRRAIAGGATVAECVVRSGSELSAKVRLGEVELLEEASHSGVGLRVMRGQRVASTSTCDLSEGGIARFVADALELAELAQEDPFAGPVEPSRLCDPRALPSLELHDPACATIDAAAAIALARRGEKSALDADRRLTNSEGATFSRTEGVSALVLSSGFRASTRGSYASLSVVPLAEDADDKKRRGFYYDARRHLADLLTPEAIGAEAARRTLRKLGARSVPTGEFPVVFDPDAARSLLGLFAGCILGGSVWRRASYLCEREGQPVAAPGITIVDDPLVVRGPGSRAFDGEGVASHRNVVVEEGVLRTYLCDGYSARKLGRATTANASRGGGASVGPSTTNFVLQAGATSSADIVKGTARGLYVTEMMGFGFNAVTGDFSRGAAGFWIENGELAYPASEVTISLNFKDLWDRIDAIGSDLDLRSSIASPTLRVARMTVAGSAGAP
jgi:PmbA protein